MTKEQVKEKQEEQCAYCSNRLMGWVWASEGLLFCGPNCMLDNLDVGEEINIDEL